VEALWVFGDQVMSSPPLVWTVAFFMSAAAGYILHTYLDDLLHSFVIAVAMYVSILVANTGFTQLGVFFTTDKEANVVAAAGASICAVTILAVIILRIAYAIGDFRRWFRGSYEPRA
jgi:tryptophan-rich sensory protein